MPPTVSCTTAVASPAAGRPTTCAAKTAAGTAVKPAVKPGATSAPTTTWTDARPTAVVVGARRYRVAGLSPSVCRAANVSCSGNTAPDRRCRGQGTGEGTGEGA